MNEVLTEGLPSQETRDVWLHAFRKTGDYPASTIFNGKWLIWFHAMQVDRQWQRIKGAVEQGYLGNQAKVATAASGAVKQGRPYVVCVYTYDWTDVIDVMGIREALRELGITREIRYKTDADTRARRYGDDYTPIYRA